MNPAAAVIDPWIEPAPDADAILTSARRLASAGQLESAYQALEAGERRFPDVAAVAVQRAHVARDLGRRDEAAALLARARARFPEDDEAIIETGWLEHIARHWEEASRWWAVVRSRTPQHVVGFVNGAIALREQGLIEDAEALLLSATERFSHQSAPWIEYAVCAQRRQDWAACAARWQQVRERFADVPDSYLGEAQALREQGRFGDAQSLLDEAAQRFPDDLRIKTESCWLAHIAQDWPEAERRWEKLRLDHPALVVGWTSGAVALRGLHRFPEADALLVEAKARFAHERSVWTEYAWLAFARRDWPEAMQRWADVRERYPDFPEAYLRGAAACAENWEYAAAEALLREGMKRFPSDPAFANDHAALAMRENRLDEAGVRYRELRTRFPSSVEGYLGSALVLRNGFHLTEAEAELEHAFPLFPRESRLWLEHARIPVFAPLRRDRKPDEALRRLSVVRERFPDLLEGYTAAIRVLIDEHRLEEAESLAHAALERFPQSAAAAVEYANLAATKGDWTVALQRYGAAVERFPTETGARIGMAKALAATGDVLNAESRLREVIEHHPDAAAAYTAYAELAMHRGDWTEALARWQRAADRFPDDKSFVQRIFDVRLHLTGEFVDTAEAATSVQVSDTKGRLKDLVMQFESLGGRGLGCEFGIFQREFGAEPLGLLRWADMHYEGIIQTLESRFAGVGEPENTEVFVNHANGRAEYCTRDLRGFMFMRAFVYEDEMPMERMRKQALRRLVFLRDKLIGDLEAGNKIFVWRCTERNLSDEEIERLHAAVRSYGKNTLLYVRYEEEGFPNGTVVSRAPGLLIGYIDRFKMDAHGTLSSAPPTASWTRLCERAHALFAERHGT